MIVKEKEERIAIMMKMNGLKTWVYYMIHYCKILLYLQIIYLFYRQQLPSIRFTFSQACFLLLLVMVSDSLSSAKPNLA
jgi:hypothetical protein